MTIRRGLAAIVAAGILGACARSAGARADGDAVWYKPMPGIVPAASMNLGLYRGSDFRVVRGACRDCPASPQALWYFQDEVIAVPVDTVPVANFTRGVDALTDVRRWYVGASETQREARPPLIWLAATHVTRDVTLSDGNRLRFADGRAADWRLVPKLASNRAYYDASSEAFLRQRTLRMRGELRGNTFTARTIWPQDWAIDEKKLRLEPLLANEALLSLVRRHQHAQNETFEARLLWERAPVAPAARDWSGRAVLALMLNGAQGDDDEAHGGHFAVVTGRHAGGAQAGAMADWLVNNIYNLASHSEKGLTAAVVPMDNYLADLNSGQAWYRPSYMLVAVLKHDRAAYAYQAAIARVFHHYYRNDFVFDHARANCTGLSLDTLRALGWPIPLLGPTSTFKAIAAYPYRAIAETSLAAGRQAYDYLTEERTRLFPALAYEAAGHDLLRLAASVSVAQAVTPFTQAGVPLVTLLREDLEALVFVRLPQIPSSRAFGAPPVASYDEYMTRVPANKAQWKIIPLAPRELPANLRDAAPIAPRVAPPAPVWLAAGALAAAMVALWRFAARRRKVAAARHERA